MSEHKNPNPYRRARGIAFTVLGLGLAASVAGNIQSVYLDTPNGDTPSVGALISAVWWPGILFLMIEIAIHTPWAKTKMDRVAQWLGAGVIGALAFYISYFHLAHVLSYYGYDVVSRYAGPLAVDTAMMVATYALYRIGVAIRDLATQDEAMAKAAELASVATQMAKDLVATGQDEVATEPVTTPELATVATEPANPLAALDEDWGNLEAELAAEGLALPPATEPEPAAAEEPAQEAQEAAAEAPQVQLTTVPAEAAKRIQEILDEIPAATGVAIAQALMEAGLANSTKTGRRYAAAVKNGTARVS